jgi:hypothetical protein
VPPPKVQPDPGAVPVGLLAEVREAGVKPVSYGPVHIEHAKIALDADQVFLHDHVVIADLATTSEAVAGEILITPGHHARGLSLCERCADAGIDADVETIPVVVRRQHRGIDRHTVPVAVEAIIQAGLDDLKVVSEIGGCRHDSEWI